MPRGRADRGSPSRRTFRTVLPPATGDDPTSPFEGTDERSESDYRRSAVERAAAGSAGPGGGILDATAPGVTPPVALETVSPAYPDLARRAHIEGVVVLDAVIGADGAVRDVRVAQGVSPLLDPAAVEAVRRWRYRPAFVGARPVAVLCRS